MNIGVISGEGGHTSEMLAFLKKCDLVDSVSIYVTDSKSVSYIKFEVPTYNVGYFVHKRANNTIAKLITAVSCFIRSFIVFVKLFTKVDVFVSTGPGLSIPFCIFSKLTGKKFVHLETIARVKDLSPSGKIIYLLRAIVLVQHEGLSLAYPRSTYVGLVYV